MTRGRLNFLLAALGLMGCAHTESRDVTPWFRVTTRYPPRPIIAESGGPKPTSYAEVKTKGHWTTVEGGGSPVVLVGGQRVLSRGDHGEWRIADTSGDRGELGCDGVLRRFERDGALTCVETDVLDHHPLEPRTITVRTFDNQGNKAGSWTTTLPPMPAEQVTRDFIGFHVETRAPVLAMRVHDGATPPSIVCKYGLLQNGHVVDLPTRPSRSTECDHVTVWRTELGLPVDKGASF